MGNNQAYESRLIEVGPGFWNIRGSFRVLAGIVNIGTQMSIIKLSSGKFLVVDTIPLDPELKGNSDHLPVFIVQVK
jgi:hypothetical protein